MLVDPKELEEIRAKNIEKLEYECKEQIEFLLKDGLYMRSLQAEIIEINSRNCTWMQKFLHSDIPVQRDSLSGPTYRRLYSKFSDLYAKRFSELYGGAGYRANPNYDGVEISWGVQGGSNEKKE